FAFVAGRLFVRSGARRIAARALFVSLREQGAAEEDGGAEQTESDRERESTEHGSLADSRPEAGFGRVFQPRKAGWRPVASTIRGVRRRASCMSRRGAAHVVGLRA